MARLNPGGDAGLAKQLERSMRNWEISRAQTTTSETLRSEGTEPFVTISRAVGSGGGDLARELGEKIQWSVLDKELLQLMAKDNKVRGELYETMDERDLSLFEEMVRAVTSSMQSRNDYFRTLSETILSVACQGSAIFLGRAADLILPRDVGLRVRVVASPETCVKNYAARFNVSPDEATKQIKTITDQRAEFIANHFRIKASDSSRYDLVINLDQWSHEEAIELIVSGMRMKKMIAT